MKECECPEDHSITKLGHCFDCPHYRRDQPTQIDPSLNRGACLIRDGHDDGTPHDFEWATYADETKSHGVCRCGLDYVDEMLYYGP